MEMVIIILMIFVGCMVGNGEFGAVNEPKIFSVTQLFFETSLPSYSNDNFTKIITTG